MEIYTSSKSICFCGWTCHYPITYKHGCNKAASKMEVKKFYDLRIQEHWHATGHEARIISVTISLNHIYPGGHVLDFFDPTTRVALFLGRSVEEAIAMREDVWEEKKRQYHRRFVEAMRNSHEQLAN